MSRRFDPRLLPPAPDLSIERALWEAGIDIIAGVDEAGRGALAGPVVAAAVVFSSSIAIRADLQGINDSKQLSPRKRDEWAEIIHRIALAWGVGFASHSEIDQLGIVPATHLAAHRAVEEIELQINHLLLDYLFLPEVGIPQTNLIKGDQRSVSIAAASILAKTARDKLLIDLDSEFPGYHFADHKGYATSQHLAALNRLGPSPIHRKSFAPVKERIPT
jgi:ribonuclease HII